MKKINEENSRIKHYLFWYFTSLAISMNDSTIFILRFLMLNGCLSRPLYCTEHHYAVLYDTVSHYPMLYGTLLFEKY